MPDTPEPARKDYDLEAAVRRLDGQLYANYCIKFDPAAAVRCIRSALVDARRAVIHEALDRENRAIEARLGASIEKAAGHLAGIETGTAETVKQGSVPKGRI